MKKALTIAGSDCSGGAGIQADLKTFSAHGIYGMSVIVSVVAENTERVISVFDLNAEIIKNQIDAVFEDITPDAVKIGMLSGTEQMNAVAEKLKQYRPVNTVIDPVMLAKGGHCLMHKDALNTMIDKIIPYAYILTPNIPEAEAITGLNLSCSDDVKEACVMIHAMGAENVIIKGGHSQGDAEDILYDGKNFYSFCSERIDTRNTHGTGCTFSSAVASNLAVGADVRTAVKNAKEYITGAIKHSLEIGHGHGPTNHFYNLFD